MTAFPIGYHDAVALAEIHESPWNPRKTFDGVKLGELAASLAEKGCLTPLVGRPRKGGGVEIGAGHRRRRAAQLSGLEALPVVVRALSDVEFLELLVIENDQREDVHELEQAEGYRRLMMQDGYSAKRIAEKVGRSEKFVFDRIKLLQLAPLAQKLFLAGKMTAGHAILLARLTPEQQLLAIGTPEEEDHRGRFGGLFEHEGGLFDDEEAAPAKGPLAAFEDLKPVSVRELDHWIGEHVRFDPKRADPFLFPTVVTAVAEAPKPLVPITRNHHIQDEARDGNVRTYGPASWKEVDPKKPCKYMQGAVIVVGEGRGDVLQVCLSSHRDQCATHWAKEQKAAAQNRKQNEKGTSTRRVDNTYEKQEERRKAEEARRGVVQARYKAAAPALVKAIATAIDKAPLARLGKTLLEYVRVDRWTAHVLKVEDFHRMGGTAEGILRHLAFLATVDDCSLYRLEETMTVAGKTWGVDVKAILDKEAPASKPEKPAAAAAAKPKKKAGKK